MTCMGRFAQWRGMVLAQGHRLGGRCAGPTSRTTTRPGRRPA
ncbi:hypothetical protein NKG94_45300 [Micromonospora sp. M12]